MQKKTATDMIPACYHIRNWIIEPVNKTVNVQVTVEKLMKVTRALIQYKDVILPV